MRKLYSALLCISILMTSCSDSGKEDQPVDPNPLPDENAGNYVEFTCNLFPMTRAAVAEDAVTEARLYAWGRELQGQKYQDEKDFLYGYTDCFFYTMDKATR
ncbi:MAG: hypothetical protein HUJ94_07920, partial [Bacteroidales bacterium]|nr:hypothetical protein [Bacteroidales bacterium]